ncbi:MAG: ABC transporter substrate-binding protein [Erysipelotrichia bacterium]|nr:ABC transporter substrate-binding protein [Erysipelotrichia bacterium]NCC54933.1 ABC transporter substrate-binding protein [Erysipelotrichia bacterium]
MKKLMMLGLALLMSMSLVACGSDKKVEYKIGLVQLMDHTSLNTIKDAIIDELKEEGYVDGENISIDYQNAGGDTSTLDTICKQYEAEDVDVIIAITTPAAQAAAPYAEKIPVIFSAVSDVKEAGLVNDMEKPDLNITGTSDEIQVDSIMDLAKQMYPNTKTIGYLYNSGEDNSIANLKKVEAYAKENGLSVNKAAVTSAADISTALASLLENSDIIFSPTDNTVASAMAQVSEMCNNAKIPFFAGADSMVKDGGLATIGINYEKLGRESAEMAIKVLTGTKIKDIPVKVYKEDLNLYINTTTAKTIGFDDIDTLKANYDVIPFE